jgi:hypothetical protein
MKPSSSTPFTVNATDPHAEAALVSGNLERMRKAARLGRETIDFDHPGHRRRGDILRQQPVMISAFDAERRAHRLGLAVACARRDTKTGAEFLH